MEIMKIEKNYIDGYLDVYCSETSQQLYDGGEDLHKVFSDNIGMGRNEAKGVFHYLNYYLRLSTISQYKYGQID